MVFKASNFCNIFDSEILDSEFNLKKNLKRKIFDSKETGQIWETQFDKLN